MNNTKQKGIACGTQSSGAQHPKTPCSVDTCTRAVGQAGALQMASLIGKKPTDQHGLHHVKNYIALCRVHILP